MTIEMSTKIVNFITPRAGVLVFGHGHISDYLEYVLSSTLSIYNTLIAIVLRDYDAVFRYHHWFSFILWWGCWYTNMSSSDKNQCKVSVTQVIVKARDLYFFELVISAGIFRQKLGNKIFLWPSSSSSRSFNRNSTETAYYSSNWLEYLLFLYLLLHICKNG